MLADYAAAAAKNANGLLEDAELLLSHGRNGRAYAMAALSVEEVGKALGVIALAMMPYETRRTLSAETVRSMLGQHLLKHVGGHLMSAIRVGAYTETVTRLPTAELARLLEASLSQATASDQMKKRGLYSDLNPDGTLSEPTSISAEEAAAQVGRAKVITSVAGILTGTPMLETLSVMPAEMEGISAVLFGTYLNGPEATSADEAASAMQSAMVALREHLGGTIPGET